MMLSRVERAERQGLYWPRAMREALPLDQRVKPQSPRPSLALLINPFYPKDPHASFGKHVLTPAVGLQSLAKASPIGWEVRVWDENLLQGPPPYDPFPLVVGITVHLTFARRAYALADWYRQRGARVVLGGLHMESSRDEAWPHADAIVTGDGTAVWRDILADAQSGRLKPHYHGGRGVQEDDRSLDVLTDARPGSVPPDRVELPPRSSFLTTLSLVASTGCRNRCGFCYLSTRGVQTPYRTRPVASVIREISASSEPYAVFLDNNLGADPEYLRSLCRGLRGTRKIWSAAVDLQVTDDPSLIREMALGGCTGVFVGLETLNEENLRATGKRTAAVDDYVRRLQIFHNQGIQVNGSFVFGFDGDGPDVFAETAAWIEANRMESATFHILTPYPGTPLFRKLEQEQRLRHRNWDLYDTAHAVFLPKKMTPEELEAGYDWIYRRTFSWASIWRRKPSSWSVVAPYLAMAALYKKSNRLWHFLIRHQLVHAAWQPLVAWTRWRHLRWRSRQEIELQTHGSFPHGAENVLPGPGRRGGWPPRRFPSRGLRRA